MWGLDHDRKPYVHIRIFKGGRLYGEVFSKSTVQITCRDCFRKHNIIIRDRSAHLRNIPESSAIAANTQDNPLLAHGDTNT